jgi:O-acetyl-ADP-ribose deacetylase
VKSFQGGRIEVKQGDITAENVDAVVNAANSSLLGGGGVDGAIHRAGGPDILRECKRIRENDFPKGLPTGEAVITTGGNLPARFVIHTAGPVWHGGKKKEEEKLKDCYQNSLMVALKNECKTVAFPAISTGVYGYPRELAAKVASKAVADFLKNRSEIEKAVFVFFSEEDMEVFLENAGL